MKDNTNSLIAVRLLSKTSPALAIAEIGHGPPARTAPKPARRSSSRLPAADDPATQARQICSRCPVRDDCLAYALDANELFGIWGGLDPRERQNLRASAASSTGTTCSPGGTHREVPGPARDHMEAD